MLNASGKNASELLVTMLVSMNAYDMAVEEVLWYCDNELNIAQRNKTFGIPSPAFVKPYDCGKFHSIFGSVNEIGPLRNR